MNGTAAKTLRLAALAAGLLFCGLPALAQEEADAADRLAEYEVGIASGNPILAAAFLRDGEARELAEAGPRGAALLGKAEALKDLKDLLALPWDEARINQLNQSLTIRIDADKPLSGLGVGPEPEKLLTWLGRFAPTYPAAKKTVVTKAIRQWEVIFGTMTDTRAMSWAQADLGSGQGVQVTKAAWERMVLRERNAVIERLITNDPRFLVYNDQRLAAARQEATLDRDVRAFVGTLPPGVQSQLSGKSFEDQLYLLGNMFDNSSITAAPDLRARINSARSSLPQEVLPSGQRQVLGTMLNTSVAAELRGTQAGDRALAAFPGGLRITVAPVSGGYSRYDPATGSVVLDSETIQQYMRIKGYTATSVMSNPAQLAEIAKYMSPAVVYEAAHKSQADWAQSRGVYLPRTQENEIEAMALQGLFTTEKLQKDATFNTIMSDSRGFSQYAAKSVEIATEFKAGRSKGFATTVRQRYFSGLPSLDAAASQVLGAVTGELERRETMPAAEKASLDASGLNLAEALEMSPDELAGSVGEIQTPVLAKIQGDLSRLGVYRSRYNASDRQNSGALKALEAGTAPQKTNAPPVPV
ncbi:MAG TPA: hypothetical protein DEQ38_04705 [Elusimicrobia bacterium]|nr:MAG: hypothetical protein A2089_00670 [Elusimicrobia bacterium GWD2_63_28]HCC47402.1 hypothetical protein [Elusimicrobiota bacterium]